MNDSPLFDDSDTDYIELEKSQEIEMREFLSSSKIIEGKTDTKSSPSSPKKTIIASPRVSRQLERIGCQGLEKPKKAFLLVRFSFDIL